MTTYSVTRTLDFDKLLLERALECETPEAVKVLVDLAVKVGAGHLAETLDKQRRRLARQERWLPQRVLRLLVNLDSDYKYETDNFRHKSVSKVKEALQATNRGIQYGCIETSQGVAIPEGWRGRHARRALIDKGYRLYFENGHKFWRLPDYETPTVGGGLSLSCSGGLP